MSAEKKLKKVRDRRTVRVRSKISGTGKRPRLSVFRSSRYIYVQAIDDDRGVTIAEASVHSSELKNTCKTMKKVDAALEVGRLIARRLMAQDITEALYDRGPYLYHGRVKALADGARREGLKI
ncbi:MAG: 50S ribosomal protein L18 [Syntrophales bacterium]|nr:50S ribosomal protein L18 [Syntrophales bacterium]MCK9527878.1 50S ribosomal protein L18 [Syntrophales bacterium]MDX9921948.1 50S ribosomal protein L18 [Syntrophales bacterium]